MAVFNEPTQWDHELGNNADVSTLPDDTSATTGLASLQKLFQIINQTPLQAGGVAPSREDFNALFKILGDSIFYMQNGGWWSYNSAFDYAVGRVVLYNDNIYKCIQTNGASSTVVAPDSVSPLGSDYWIQIATLADFANFANTDLSNLSASGQALLKNKANVDFSNVSAPTQAFKNMVIDWSSPAYYQKIDINSYAVTGTVYTPPCDGYIVGHFAYTHNTGLEIGVFYDSNLYLDGFSQSTGGTMYGTINFRVNKGQGYVFTNSGVSIINLHFFPCKGAN